MFPFILKGERKQEEKKKQDAGQLLFLSICTNREAVPFDSYLRIMSDVFIFSSCGVKPVVYRFSTRQEDNSFNEFQIDDRTNSGKKIFFIIWKKEILIQNVNESFPTTRIADYFNKKKTFSY